MVKKAKAGTAAKKAAKKVTKKVPKKGTKKGTKKAAKKSAKKLIKAAAKKVKKGAASPKASVAKKAVKAAREAIVPLHSVVKFVRHLIDQNRVDEFIAAVEKSKAVVAVHPSDMRLAKTYMPADVAGGSNFGMAVAKGGGQFDDPCPGGDPFDCKKK